MPFNLDKFVASPSVEELDSLKKSEIVKVAKHYGIEFQPLMRKDEIKRYVLEYLVDEGVLSSTVLETAITVPTDNTFELKRLEIEMNKEIRLKEMEREMQKEKEEREMQMQKEKEEREMQMQREKEEREEREREEKAREHEFRLKQLELGVIKGSDPKKGLDTGGFDVSKHVKFVPKFQEDNVEKFFNHFEKLGEQLKWPRDKWSILIQSNFTGKVQEVYSALSIEDSMDYDKVKKAILQAYELVPEAYRQKFRKYRKADTQTYVEFAYQKERHFDRWCASKKVSTFDTLRQLMLVEEFKWCVNDDIKTHLEENKADNLKEVTNLADQYALTHKFGKVGQTQNKGQFNRPNKKYGNSSNSSGTTSNSGSQSGSISPTNSGKKQPDSSRQKNDQASSNKAAFKDITCGFCHKKGHTMANCFTLAKLKETETASNALANAENSSEVVVTLRPNSNDKIKEEYLPFLSEGFISLDGNSAHPPVKIKILRDTGATQSLLLDGVLPLSDSTSTGANVLIQGVECGFISVPLHKINLKSDLVSGSVIVGVRPTLPVKGVSLLLGNDLAGGKVVANAILTDKPCDYNNTEQLEKEFPNLFPACAVTRAMSQKLAMDDNLKHPPSKSEDTVPKSGTSRESCKDDNLKHPLSKNEGMISENKDGKLNHPPSKIEELVPKNGTTLPKEESESGKDSSKNIHESEDSWYDLSQSFMTNLNDSQDCESPGPTHSEGVEQEKSKMSDTLHRDQLSVQQQHDEELQPLIAGALTEDESKDVPVCFYFKNNILMRKWRPPDALLDEEWRIYHQIVVPRTYRREILSIAHEMPFAGHLGVNKTYHRILNHFYWPKLKSDVAKFCKTCHSCQMVGKPNQNIPAAPLKPVPAFEEPFSRVIIDCVGPLPKSRAGHQYILTIMCASTRFPEAIPLRNIKARTVLQALLKFFTLFGLPKEIQSDQGSNFMSTVFQQMLYELGIDQIKSSAYHPESQGALERFHQTLKNMLKTYCHDNERDWDEGIPFVMFAARESIQESLGFSPFELVFGHTVRGPLKLLKEKWLSDPGEDIHLLDYVSRFKDRLHGACELAQENLRHSQKKMKAWYDKTTVKREFKPGDKVLVFLPVSGQPLQARFQGPYVIERKVSDTDYVILTPDKRKSRRVCHINMMKRYYEREDCDISKDESIHDVNSNTNDTGDQVCIINTDHELSNDEIKANNVPDMCIKLQNSDVLKNLDQKLRHLDHKEKSEMKSLIYEYACLFSDDPTRTNLIEHDVDVGDATPIKQHPYRVNPRKRQHLRDEVRYMLDHDIIEPSNSEWSSPCILVPKPDSGYRFCTDYRKVNAVTRTDSYPIPRIDDCIDRIGKATYVSKFDLLKGYWEILLTERAQKISAFVTPDGLFQYKVMPFGMKNSPMTFQRLVNNLTSNLENCEVYVDDLIVYSNSWDEHVQHVKALFDKLAKANLTVNLVKSEIACAHVVYLGHVVGQGKVRPIKAKVEGIDKFPAPTDKRQLMRFLGMAGYYRRFCPNFSDIAAPLTKLLKKNEKFDWTDNCQAAFELLKKALMSSPVLIAPDFEKQFKLAVDASDNGIGAVLLQADEHGVDHPVCYYSKKFDKHQKNYSTIENETLALILGLQHFDVYLGTTSFPITVYTDHNPLTFLSKMKNKNQRLMRWSLFLQSYNVDIKHIKGKDNVVPDSLSRI
ncbi:hypothetical protein HOLleu_09080 [Holothuria leucospilota]|uniref:Reverse transcriptase n=1 Tax=Holothuria leucospilota TaxID=206669 RepID=A0A9Q1CJA8_HOLLE|nr:hypothetical protein HOLleu_09080 [Holothuria leucospilota]